MFDGLDSAMEHNAVWRPLNYLKENKNFSISILPIAKNGYISIDLLEKCVTSSTKALIVNHTSNVTGNTILLEKMGEYCKNKGLLFIVDSSQSAGLIPISMKKNYIDILVFSGHKFLMGPTGTGVLCLNKNMQIQPFMQGGAGNSFSDNMPTFYPEKLEAGTQNATGIMGLKAGIEFLIETGLENIQNKIYDLTGELILHLKNIPEITLYLPKSENAKTSLVSFNIKDVSPADTGFWLDSEYNILTRTGLHCAPLAHKSMGTFPDGCVRISPGYFNSSTEIQYTINAIKSIISTHKK